MLTNSWAVRRRPCSKSASTRFIRRYRKTCRSSRKIFYCGKLATLSLTLLTLGVFWVFFWLMLSVFWLMFGVFWLLVLCNVFVFHGEHQFCHFSLLEWWVDQCRLVFPSVKKWYIVVVNRFITLENYYNDNHQNTTNIYNDIQSP